VPSLVDDILVAGRPKKLDELRELVATMARDNPDWGYTRIRDALAISDTRLLAREATKTPAAAAPIRTALTPGRWIEVTYRPPRLLRCIGERACADDIDDGEISATRPG